MNPSVENPVEAVEFKKVRWPPVRWRWLNRWYAQALGYFWLACPICGKEFGGHELRAGHILWRSSSQGSSVCYKEICHEIALAMGWRA